MNNSSAETNEKDVTSEISWLDIQFMCNYYMASSECTKVQVNPINRRGRGEVKGTTVVGSRPGRGPVDMWDEE